MKTIICAIAGSAVVALAGCGSSTSSSKPIDTSKLTKIECSELHFSDEFLKKYPEAPAACVEAREYQGKRYAKFQAKVYLNSPDRTTVQLLNTRGDPLSTFSFKPGPDAAVDIDGKKTKFTDLKKGEKISFYVSEDRLAASEQPGATEESWAVLPPQ